MLLLILKIKNLIQKYWRGPVWINLNWILYNGLKRYGFNEIAQRIKDDSIFLIEKNGFYEYFDPRKKFQILKILDMEGLTFHGVQLYI